MAKLTQDQLLEAFASMSVLELADFKKAFEDKFRIPLIEGYGLSEASPVVTKNPLDGSRKAGSIGADKARKKFDDLFKL